MTVACRDVEAATLARDGSPPITRTTFPTCRAPYPGGSSGCVCRLLPRSRGLPQMAGGSASALSLSRPAQASLMLRPAGSLSRPEATFVTRLQPMRLPAQAARQLPDQSTTPRVDSSSTDDSRLRGALPGSDICAAAKKQLYSITSSARTRRDGGTSSPSTFAVLRVRTVWYFVGACTGSSAGLAPRRMRSTYEAASRYCSRISVPYDMRPPAAAKKRNA